MDDIESMGIGAIAERLRGRPLIEGAIILIALGHEKAAGVFSRFGRRTRSSMIMKLGTLGTLDAKSVSDAENGLNIRLDALRRDSAGGRPPGSDILYAGAVFQSLDDPIALAILEDIGAKDGETAERLRSGSRSKGYYSRKEGYAITRRWPS